MRHHGKVAVLAFFAPAHAQPFAIREVFSSEHCLDSSIVEATAKDIVQVCMAPENFRVELFGTTIVYRYYGEPACGGTMNRSEVLRIEECSLDSAALDTNESRYVKWTLRMSPSPRFSSCC